MIDDALVLSVERLRDSVRELRSTIRSRYQSRSRAITGEGIKTTAAQLGERWLVEVSGRDDVRAVLGDTLPRLNVEFQRLITHAEQPTTRGRYESTIESILRDFGTQVVVPLKQARNAPVGTPKPTGSQKSEAATKSVFIGQSFQKEDAEVNAPIARLVGAFGFEVVTGERSEANTVSKKVRERIESADMFLGIFTRRARLRGRAEWTTSAWVIDEKAYAFARGKKLILLSEKGVQSIGGIQGDYEYIEFTRTDVPSLLIKLVETLRSLD